MSDSNTSEEVYKLLGKFFFRFEHIANELRLGIAQLIYPDFSNAEFRRTEILLEGVTADPLRAKFLALVQEHFSSETEIFRVAKFFATMFGNIIPLRNSLAHGTSYFMGEMIERATNPEGHILFLRHAKLKKTGIDLNPKKFHSSTLTATIQLLQQLHLLISNLNVIIQNQPITQAEITLLNRQMKEIEDLNKNISNLH